LICATTSASSGATSSSAVGIFTLDHRPAGDENASMIAPSTCGFSDCHVVSPDLVHSDEIAAQEHPGDARQTEQRGRKRAAAGGVGGREIRGAGAHHIAPGRNFSVAGLGVPRSR